MNKGEHKTEPLAVHWFRRDLRLEDNRALARALDSGLPVLPVFIFDSQIIEELQADDARVSFIYKQLEHIQGQLAIHHSSLQVYMGKPADVWNELLALYEIRAVYANRDYEPYAIQRDNEVAALLAARGIPFHRYKDQVIFEENEIVKKDGKPYTVFTPYKRRWLEKYNAAEHLLAEEKGRGRFLSLSGDLPKPEALGFRPASIQVKPYDLSGLKSYGRLRDSPSADATSHLSPHLRFGTVSVRSILRRLEAGDEVFLSELIWREFFMQILFHFPHVVNQNFNPRYNGVRWVNDEEQFRRWCEGTTGYPMVDAGMRQLHASGTMHNRVRMITAGFLCKHLLVDWRMGEAYFAEKLLDYELSSNNGNWQWAAGTGCDAAPYFRIFNPMEQMRKFDRDATYVKRWIPEYGTPAYPAPIIDHGFARKRALETYRKGMEDYLPEG